MERIQLSPINLLSVKDDEVAANRRRPGRVTCERLRCSNGVVADLSRTGARLRVRTMFAPRRNQARALVFETVMGPSMTFPCRIIWVRGAGAFRYDVGVAFEGLTEQHEQQLIEIGRVHAGTTMVRPTGKVA